MPSPPERSAGLPPPEPSAVPTLPRGWRVLAGGAVLFGGVTILAGGAVLFGGEAAQRAAGAAVPFVVTFNFLAGFAYVAAGIGLWRGRRWAAWLALGIALATAVVLGAFGLHVAAGRPFEPRTAVALVFRAGVWLTVGLLALRRLRPAHSGQPRGNAERNRA